MIDFQPELDFQPEEPGFSLSRAIANAYDQATIGADAALSLPAGALQQAVTGEDTVFKEWEARKAAYEARMKQRGSGSLTEKTTGMLATLPLQMLGMLGSPAEKGSTFIQQGESPNRAMLATYADTALNAAGLSPMAAAKTLAARVTIGGTANTALGAASDATSQTLAEKQTTKDLYDPYDPERRLLEAVTGGVLHGTLGERPTAPSKTPGLENKLDSLIKEDTPVKPVLGKQGELLLDFKPEDLPEIDTSKITNPYDVAKYVSELKEGNVKELDATITDLFASKAQELEQTGTNLKQNKADTTPLEEAASEPPQASPIPGKDGENFTVGDRTYSGKELPEAHKFIDAIKETTDINGTKVYLLDLGHALSKISKDVAYPDSLRTIAAVLKNKYVDKYADNIYAELPTIDGTLQRNALDTRNVAGYYDPNVIEVDSYKFGLSGLKASTVVHEIMHGATVKLMQARPESAPVKALVKIWDWSRNMAENIGQEGQYGFKDVYEMISEAYSNPDFQKVMSKIDLPYSMRIKNTLTTVWDNIKYGIAKLFNGGKEPSETLVTALEGVLHHTGDLLKAYDIFPTEGSKKSLAEHLKNQADTLSTQDRLSREAFSLQRPSSIERLAKHTRALATSIDEKVNGTTDLRSKASTFKPEPTAQEVVKGPLKKEMNSYIPEDPVPETIIKEALASGDSTIKYASLQSGAILTGIKYKSPLIQGVGRLLLNATKRADVFTQKVIRPVEKTFDKIFRDPQATLDVSTILKKEMFSNKRFTADELRSIGVSERIIVAHQQLRSMFDATLQKQNESLALRGEPPITAKTAYLASRWQGSYRIPVYEGNRLVWYIAERSEKAAKAALQHLKQNGVKVNEELSKLEFRGHGYKEGNTIDAYRTMLSLLDKDDPRVATIKSIMEDAVMSDAYNILGQSKHFENKSNVRGFIGDQPWKEPVSAAKEMIKQQFQYAKNAGEWAEMNVAMDKLKPILSNETLQQTQPNNMKFVKEHVKSKLGMGEDATIAQLEDKIAKLFGRDVSSFKNVVGSVKGVYYTITFGLNLPFAAMSTMQGAFAAPWHMKLSADGHKFNPATVMTKSTMDASAIVLHHEMANRGIVKDIPMTTIGKEAMKYAEDNGIIERNMFDESRELGRNPALRTALNIANLTITFPEKVARTLSFMSFVHHLDEGGKFKDSPMELFKTAEDMTYATMADYRKGERPLIFSKFGVLGDAASTLRTFSFNYYNQLHTLSRDAMKGSYAPLITFLATQAMLGGAVSLPFLVESDKALDFIKETFAPYMPASMFKEISGWDIRKFLIQNLPDWAAYGGVSTLSGVDFSSRMNSPNFVPEASWDSLFPFAIPDIREAKSILNFLQDPNEDTAAQIAYAHVPNGLQGAVETLYPGFKTGQVTSEGTGYYNPKDLTKFGAVRSPTEEVIRGLGMRSLKEAERKDLLYRQSKEEMFIKDKQTQIEEQFIRAVLRGDKESSGNKLADYIKLGGDYDKLSSSIERRLLLAKVPQEDLIAIRAQGDSLSSAMKLQRYVDLLKAYKEQYK